MRFWQSTGEDIGCQGTSRKKALISGELTDSLLGILLAIAYQSVTTIIYSGQGNHDELAW